MKIEIFDLWEILIHLILSQIGLGSQLCYLLLLCDVGQVGRARY